MFPSECWKLRLDDVASEAKSSSLPNGRLVKASLLLMIIDPASLNICMYVLS